MKLGPFISVVSAAFAVEEKTVKLFARNLREAGLLTTGARGKNAPEMSARDLAVMTISLLATDKPARAVELFHYYAGMQIANAGQQKYVEGFLPNSDHTLLDLVTLLCDPAVSEAPKMDFTISFVGTLHAVFERSDMILTYHSRIEHEKLTEAAQFLDHGNPDDLFDFLKQSPLNANGILITREISSNRLIALRTVLFADGQPLEEALSDVD